MSLPVLVFAVVAAAVVVSALGVVISRSIVRAAVWLLFTLIGISLLYFFLGAEFLGAAHLIVYVGGTMVLVVFGVMLTSAGPFQLQPARPYEWIVGSVLSATLLGLMVSATLGLATRPTIESPSPTTGELGLAFLGVTNPADGPAFLLPFEIVSVHLLVVLIAAAYLARAKRSIPAEGATS